MKKYTIVLDDEQVERIRRMAEAEMKTEEQLLRDLIGRYAVERGHERVFAMEGVVEGPGGSVADVPEEELLEGFGE
jgi:hypothetical protein